VPLNASRPKRESQKFSFGGFNGATLGRVKGFTLRGKAKVSAQWLMFCMVHKIEKIATQGQQ
tara:strand:+ start:3403 stop:3588 length:186 start_codon:yes stop_codon:yes gene_type:complete